jgi:histidinol-phosphate/aromatic aminotransferase/cobyric acid decarboxylase-like protein
LKERSFCKILFWFAEYKYLLQVFVLCQIGIGETSTFELNADVLETTIMEQKATGKAVKAFFLVNPNNPLGEVYSSQLVLQLIEVCHRSALIWLDFLIL